MDIEKTQNNVANKVPKKTADFEDLSDHGFQDDDLEDFQFTKAGVKGDKKGRTYEETIMQAQAIATNKTIDQELLKTVVNYNFDKTYNSICERMRNHLKPDIADKILSDLSKAFKKDIF